MAVSITVLVAVMAFGIGFASAGLLFARRLRAAGPMFACKIRRAPGRVGRRFPWPVFPAHAVWVHDVLFVVRGVVARRVRPLATRSVETPAQSSGPDEVRGLGPKPLVVTLHLDDEASVTLAAATESREILTGPYLVAAVEAANRGSDAGRHPRDG